MDRMVSVSPPLTAVAHSPRRLRPAVVWAIALIAVMAAAADGLWPYIRPAESLFVAAVALAAIAVSMLITRRVLVATVMTAALLVIVRTVSVTKEDITN